MVTMPSQLRKIVAIITGGSASGLFVVHVLHVTVVAAVPAYQFVCRIGV